MMLTEYLSFGLIVAILFLTLEGTGRDATYIFPFFCFLVVIVMYAGTWFSMIAVLFLLTGSVWTAFHEGVIFGGCYAMLLALLLIPQCHTLALVICFILRERKKMRSLVGREGMLTANVNVGHSIIEIDGEKFDGISSHLRHKEIKNLPDGAAIVVRRTFWTSLDVELKPPEGDSC
jgi:hypothetical protein